MGHDPLGEFKNVNKFILQCSQAQ